MLDTFDFESYPIMLNQIRDSLIQINMLSYKPENLRLIKQKSDILIDLLDSLDLISDLERSQLKLDLEPVNLSEMLGDFVLRKDQLVSQNHLMLNSKDLIKLPVLTNRQILIRSLDNMVASISNLKSHDSRQKINIFTKRSKSGVFLGVHSKDFQLKTIDLNRFKKIALTSKRPLQYGTIQAATHLYIANKLLTVCGGELKIIKHRGQFSLATYLQPSYQISMF